MYVFSTFINPIEYLSIYLSIYPSIYLSIYLSMYLYIIIYSCIVWFLSTTNGILLNQSNLALRHKATWRARMPRRVLQPQRSTQRSTLGTAQVRAEGFVSQKGALFVVKITLTLKVTFIIKGTPRFETCPLLIFNTMNFHCRTFLIMLEDNKTCIRIETCDFQIWGVP